MIGIDTNVLVRFIVQDEPKQLASFTVTFDERAQKHRLFRPPTIG